MSHRRIYKQAHGEIPVDTDGRTFDVHHIDRDRSNNDPTNLVALPIKEHYELHLAAGEYKAAHAILLRMKIAPTERKRLAKQAALQRSKEGTHHFLGGELQRRVGKRKVQEGTHHFQQPEHAERVRKRNIARSTQGLHEFQSPEALQRLRERNTKGLANKTHPFARGVGAAATRKRVAEGTHHFQNVDTQKANSAKAKLKNAIRVRRIGPDEKSELFIGVSDAVRATPNCSRKKLEAALNTGEAYLDFVWIREKLNI